MTKKKILLASTGLVVIVLLLSTVALVRLQGSRLPGVAGESLMVQAPGEVAELRDRGLRTDYVVDGLQFAGKMTGSVMPGELVVDWYAPDSGTFRQEVWVERSPLRAFRDYHWASPKPGFRGEVGRDLARSVDLPDDVTADSADLFCGNIGRSKTDEFEDCQVWGYWARYGQYLVYLELAGVHETSRDMRAIVQFVDDRMPQD
jgi:hypothetical protein